MSKLRTRIEDLEKKVVPSSPNGWVRFIADDQNPCEESKLRELAEDIVLNDKGLITLLSHTADHKYNGSKEKNRLDKMIEQVRHEIQSTRPN